MQIYQVEQHLNWACPGMLLFVENGHIIGRQLNPNNGGTYEYIDEDDLVFDPEDYAKVALIDCY